MVIYEQLNRYFNLMKAGNISMPEEELKNDLSNKESASIDNETPHSQEEEIRDESAPPSQEEEKPDEEAPPPQEEVSTYVAVKGVFFTPKSDNSGVFCIIYRGETGKIIFRELWTIRSNKQPDLDVSDEWEHFTREMNKTGTYDKDLSDKLAPLIEK